MRSIAFVVALIPCMLAYSTAFAEEEACSLITQAQVSAALEISVDAGTPISRPVNGVGDEAFYVYFNTKERSGLGLVVKKGSSAFEIRVYGFELDKAKSVAKTLCQAVAGKM